MTWMVEAMGRWRESSRGTTSLDVQRSGRARGEEGFALIGTLALMGIFSLTVVALLGMTFTGVAATNAAVVRANEMRAADGALQTAVNRLRTDPSAESGSTASCELAIPDLTFDQGTPGPSDDVVTQLRCCPDLDVACSQPIADAPVVPVPGEGASVDLVGDGYGGRLWTDGGWRADCGAGRGPGCLAWSSGIGLTNYAADSGLIGDIGAADLVSAGPTPLGFVGDVNVRHAAVAMRNPAGGAAPAITVGGEYSQGDLGVFFQRSGGPCGALSPTFAWTRASSIEDLTGGPSCNDPTSRNLDDGAAAPAPPQAPDRPGDVPDACPPEPVVTLGPGRYGAGETAELNRLWSGSCHRTYLFTPGDYWFDVDDPANPAAERNSLRMADPASSIVFGTPKGWDAATGATAADFPDACEHDPADSSAEHDGVSVTLSSRTSISHTAGRVAMCGHRTNGTTLPVIWQDPSPADGWVARPSAADDVSPATAMNAPDAILAGPDGNLTGSAVECPVLSTVCTSVREIALTGWGGAQDPGPAKLSSAVVLVNGNSANGNGNGPGAFTRFDVYPKSGSAWTTTPLCSATFAKIADRWNTVAFDLLQGSGDCSSYLTDRSQLYQSKIVISLGLASLACPYLWPCYTMGSIDSAVLVTNVWSASPDPTKVEATGWADASDSAIADGRSATGQVTCQWGLCKGMDKASLTFRDFTESAGSNPLVPSSNLLGVGVVIRGNADTYINAVKRLTITLTLGDGRTCNWEWAQMGFDQQSTYEDLMDPQFGTCAALLAGQPNDVFRGATVTLGMAHYCWAWDPICFVFATPTVDAVSLWVTSGGFTRPQASNLITSNASPGTDHDARFNVFGPVSIPHNDLDVRWTGPARDTWEPSYEPLIGGSLVAAGLGSDVDASRSDSGVGVVCCRPAKPSKRTVRINALIEGVVRGTALVEIVDSSGGVFHPGSDLTIVDWRTCGSEGCT